MRSVLSALTFVSIVAALALTPAGNLSAQFQGSEFCLSCHNGAIAPDKTSWRETYHHLAFADPDTLPGVITYAAFQAGLDLQSDPDFS